MVEKIALRRELFNQRASGMTSYFLICFKSGRWGSHCGPLKIDETSFPLIV